MKETSPLTTMSRRFEDNPEYMAYALAQYRRENQITEDELLTQLQITEPFYGRLAMCKRPHDYAQFLSVAQYTRVNKEALRLILE